MNGSLIKFVIIGILALLLGLSIGQLKPMWLTHLHGEEVRQAIQRYFTVTNTIVGDIDPAERDPVDDTPELHAKYCPSN